MSSSAAVVACSLWASSAEAVACLTPLFSAQTHAALFSSWAVQPAGKSVAFGEFLQEDPETDLVLSRDVIDQIL